MLLWTAPVYPAVASLYERHARTSEAAFRQQIALFAQLMHFWPVMPAQRSEIARYALYGEASAPVAPEFLHIEDIPSRSALYDWVIAPHTHHGIFQLLMITDGTASVTLDGARVDIDSPAFVCVPSSCVHAFSFGAGTQGWVLSVANELFHDPRLAMPNMDAFMTASRGMVVRLEGRAREAGRLQWLLADIAERMALEHGEVPPIVVALLSACLGVAGECIETPLAAGAGPDRRLTLVRGFEALVDAHYRQHLKVADYARDLAVTTATLTRACRAISGKAPGDIILDRMLLEAMRYLRHTAASAKQIADRLGYEDPAYFARFFKARSGMTTREFRQAQGGERK